MIGGGYFSQVSGLGRREPGSGIQVRVQVRALSLSRGRADHPWSAAVEQGCSTLPKAGAFKIQVQDLNFTPYPYLYLITRTRDLRAET